MSAGYYKHVPTGVMFSTGDPASFFFPSKKEDLFKEPIFEAVKQFEVTEDVYLLFSEHEYELYIHVAREEDIKTLLPVLNDSPRVVISEDRLSEMLEDKRLGR